MDPKNWHNQNALKLLTLVSCELLVHGTVLFGAFIAFSSLKGIEQAHTKPLVATVILFHLFRRGSSFWSPKRRWKHAFLNQNIEVEFWRDLAQNRGTNPSSPLWERALSDLSQQNSPKMKPLAAITHGFYQLLLSSLLVLAIIGFDRLPIHLHSTQDIDITVTPPPYVKLPKRSLHPAESELQIFAGSLITWDSEQELLIHDNKKRRYRSSKTSNGQNQVRARVMENTRFFQHDELNLSVSLLADASPVVSWVAPPKQLKFAPTSLSFKATDDIGIEETLINVNGREVEYAGNPNGDKSMEYRWTFDPNDHLNLMGGNINLYIVAYDNDRVKGPKAGRSTALTWEFPGLDALAKGSLKELQEVIDQSQKRLEQPLKTTGQSVLKEMKELEQSLALNPAIGEPTRDMITKINDDYEAQLQSQGEGPQVSSKESDQLKRNLPLLRHLETVLTQITQMVSSARMIQKLNRLSEQYKQGEQPSEDFQDLHQQLEQHLQSKNLPKRAKEEILRQLNQAELAALMGKKEEASQKLEDLSSLLRQLSESGSNVSPEISELFQELLQDLEQLIDQQTTLKSIASLNAPKNTSPPARLKLLSQHINQSPEYHAYKELVTQLRKPNQNQQEQQRAIKRLQNPKDPAFIGREMKDLERQLNRVLNGNSSKIDTQRFAKIKPLNDILIELENELEASAPTWQPSTNLIVNQSAILQTGQGFTKSFRLNFEPVLPIPQLYSLADLAVESARQATQQLQKKQAKAINSMEQSRQLWVQLRYQLQQLGQSSQNQGQGQNQSTGMPQLTLGPNGELQLQPSGGRPGDHQDGSPNQAQDVDIALPEDFKNPREIEKKLKESLRSAPNEEQKRSFQRYMIDLLE